MPYESGRAYDRKMLLQARARDGMLTGKEQLIGRVGVPQRGLLS